MNSLLLFGSIDIKISQVIYKTMGLLGSCLRLAAIELHKSFIGIYYCLIYLGCFIFPDIFICLEGWHITLTRLGSDEELCESCGYPQD